MGRRYDKAASLLHDRYCIQNDGFDLGGGQTGKCLLGRNGSPEAKSVAVCFLDLFQVVDFRLNGLVAVQSDLDQILKNLLNIAAGVL